LTTDVLAKRSVHTPTPDSLRARLLCVAGSHRNDVIEEMAMATPSKDAQQRSAAAAVKAERALDKAAAMQEYEAEALALQANTERLRALRLAREAESKLNPAAQPPVKKKQATQGVTLKEPLKEPKKATAKKRVPAPKRADDSKRADDNAPKVA
jgi:hypothetical protein